MTTDTILIDVYDRCGRKLIEGIKPVNATDHYTADSPKIIKIHENHAKIDKNGGIKSKKSNEYCS